MQFGDDSAFRGKRQIGNRNGVDLVRDE